MVERDTRYREASSALSASGIRQQFSTSVNIENCRFGIGILRSESTTLAVGDERQELREQDDSDVRRAARQVCDEQGERDDDDAVTHRARALREPEVAEVVVSQNAQALSHGKETTTGRPMGTLTRLR